MGDKLSEAQAKAEKYLKAPGAAATKADRLMSLLREQTRYRAIIVPGTDLAAEMRPITIGEQAIIEAAAVAYCAGHLGLAQTHITESEFEGERAARTMALVVIETGSRYPDEKPIGSVESWRMLQAWQMSELWRMHSDHAEQTEPLGVLSDQDRRDIANAVKKNDLTTLRWFGARRLALYVTSSDVQPSP